MGVEGSFSLNITKRKPVPPKKCVMCGSEFTRDYDMQMSSWKAKIVCSDACVIAKRIQDTLIRNEKKYGKGCLDDKPCTVCSANMTLADVSSAYAFVMKVSCSKACATVLRQIARPTYHRKKVEPPRPLSHYWGKKSAAIKFIQWALMAGPTLRARISTTTEK